MKSPGGGARPGSTWCPQTSVSVGNRKEWGQGESVCEVGVTASARIPVPPHSYPNKSFSEYNNNDDNCPPFLHQVFSFQMDLTRSLRGRAA